MYLCTYNVVVDCGNPDTPTNGSISFSSTNYSSEANISCDEGYVLIGESVRNCTESGTWSNPEVECRCKAIILHMQCLHISL